MCLSPVTIILIDAFERLLSDNTTHQTVRNIRDVTFNKSIDLIAAACVCVN